MRGRLDRLHNLTVQDSRWRTPADSRASSGGVETAPVGMLLCLRNSVTRQTPTTQADLIACGADRCVIKLTARQLAERPKRVQITDTAGLSSSLLFCARGPPFLLFFFLGGGSSVSVRTVFTHSKKKNSSGCLAAWLSREFKITAGFNRSVTILREKKNTTDWGSLEDSLRSCLIGQKLLDARQ